MWNVRKENDKVILVVNGERALCRQGKEFGPVKGITTGKKSGELVVSIFFFFGGGGGCDRWGPGGGGGGGGGGQITVSFTCVLIMSIIFIQDT